MADRGARQGVNPQTGEKIQIAATQGAPVQRRLRPEGRRSRARPSQAPRSLTGGRGHTSPTGWRRSSRSAAVASSWVSIPTRPRSGRRRSSGCRRPEGSHLARIRTAEAVAEHCRAAIVAAGPACVAVKLQLACFERLGAAGWEALERAVAVARDHGLLVIADGKRGDVPVTARAYAQALVGATPGPFGDVEGLGVDAFTANPLLGRRRPRAPGRGRRGGRRGLLRARPHVEPRGGRPAGPGRAAAARAPGRAGGRAGRRARGGERAVRRGRGHRRHQPRAPRAGCASSCPARSSCSPAWARRAAGWRPSAPAFEPHPAAGLVAASRSIVGAYRERGGDPAAAAADAAEDLRAVAWNL